MSLFCVFSKCYRFYVIFVAFAEQADCQHESEGADGGEGAEAGDLRNGLQHCVEEKDEIGES